MVRRGWIGLLLLASFGWAWSAPDGPEVVHGQVQINQSGANTIITQGSDRAIINWNGFSIDVHELVRFIQPNQLAVILNRVVGQDPSTILGQLQANGRVFLINPNGILFGPESRVDVAGFMASTLDMRDEDFLNDRYLLTQNPDKVLASVVNQGEIRVTDGGFVVLVAPLVANQGLIVAELGQVALGAGRQATVNFDGQGLINFLVETPEGLEPGTVMLDPQAAAGLLSSVVKDPGIVEASALPTEMPEGTLVAGGTIDVSGANGGRVLLDSTHTTVASGTIKANGQAKGGEIRILSEGTSVLSGLAQATGRDGGTVELSGENFALLGTVDVTGLDGVAGLFYLDPATITIIDGAGGSLDGLFLSNMGVFFSDDVPPNTVSKAALEAVAAGTSVRLEATDQITVNDIAGDQINLQNGVTLELVVANGDVVFEDVNDTISTGSGGNLFVDVANGGATLGRLFAPDGKIGVQAQDDVTFQDMGTIGLMNNGSVAIMSTDGDILGSNIGTGSLVLSGTNIGTAASPINIDATSLAGLASGDINLHETDADTLDGLVLRAAIGQFTSSNFLSVDYGLKGDNINLVVDDGDLTLARNDLQDPIEATVVGNTISLQVDGGDIQGLTNPSPPANDVDLDISGGTLTMNAEGIAPVTTLNTSVNQLSATSSTFDIAISNEIDLILASLNSGEDAFIDAPNLTVSGNLMAAADLVLEATSGSINGNTSTLSANRLFLTADDNIGGMSAPIHVDSTIFKATATSGMINVVGEGSLFGIDQAEAGTSVSLHAANGDLQVFGPVGADGGPIALTATGDILMGSGGSVEGGSVFLEGESVGTASNPFEIDATTLAGRATNGGFFVQELDSFSMDGLTIGTVTTDLGSASGVSATGDVILELLGGDLVFNDGVTAGNFLGVSVSSGSLANNFSGNDLTGHSVSVSAFSIGTSDAPVTVSAANLAANSSGSMDLAVDGVTIAEVTPTAGSSLSTLAGLTAGGDLSLMSTDEVALAAPVSAGMMAKLSVANGDLLLGDLVSAGTTVCLAAENGSILDDNGASLNVQAPAASFDAPKGTVGTASDPIDTAISTVSGRSMAFHFNHTMAVSEGLVCGINGLVSTVPPPQAEEDQLDSSIYPPVPGYNENVGQNNPDFFLVIELLNELVSNGADGPIRDMVGWVFLLDGVNVDSEQRVPDFNQFGLTGGSLDAIAQGLRDRGWQVDLKGNQLSATRPGFSLGAVQNGNQITLAIGETGAGTNPAPPQANGGQQIDQNLQTAVDFLLNGPGVTVDSTQRVPDYDEYQLSGDPDQLWDDALKGLQENGWHLLTNSQQQIVASRNGLKVELVRTGNKVTMSVSQSGLDDDQGMRSAISFLLDAPGVQLLSWQRIPDYNSFQVATGKSLEEVTGELRQQGFNITSQDGSSVKAVRGDFEVTVTRNQAGQLTLEVVSGAQPGGGGDQLDAQLRNEIAWLFDSPRLHLASEVRVPDYNLSEVEVSGSLAEVLDWLAEGFTSRGWKVERRGNGLVGTRGNLTLTVTPRDGGLAIEIVSGEQGSTSGGENADADLLAPLASLLKDQRLQLSEQVRVPDFGQLEFVSQRPYQEWVGEVADLLSQGGWTVERFGQELRATRGGQVLQMRPGASGFVVEARQFDSVPESADGGMHQQLSSLYTIPGLGFESTVRVPDYNAYRLTSSLSFSQLRTTIGNQLQSQGWKVAIEGNALVATRGSLRLELRQDAAGPTLDVTDTANAEVSYSQTSTTKETVTP
ncbi:MAG: filamentous hemagglutinin N-terminal domain-containing protein [Candidatus Eremiobacteraeota bacterium]|nr:filamentous hemagglutinin N-terminal domain-containing protein [Candidatus Eremiobacteraeota bacterium]